MTIHLNICSSLLYLSQNGCCKSIIIIKEKHKIVLIRSNKADKTLFHWEGYLDFFLLLKKNQLMDHG